MRIRMVLFDAFSTILVPRIPIYVQYSQTFEPYLGVLAPEKISSSFKIGRDDTAPCRQQLITDFRYSAQRVSALMQLQSEKPAYQNGASEWWGEVIRRTAVGAGADPSGRTMLEFRRVESHFGT